MKVWLSDAQVVAGRPGWHVFDDGNYRDLGSLKGNRGNQNYVIPANVQLGEFRSLAIWCDRFNVSFGAAELA
ncbi:DM13 domain-containing protein [Kribbella sp. NPDC055071]